MMAPDSATPALERRIPPPAVALVVGLAMWGVARLTPPFNLPVTWRESVAALIALLAVGVSVAAVVSFKLARTTLDPTMAAAASSLVSTGIFRFSRNPMYLGLTLLLMALTVFLDSLWTLAGPIAFVAYIDRFQIRPEERALQGIFGTAYAQYCARVRRWL